MSMPFRIQPNIPIFNKYKMKTVKSRLFQNWSEIRISRAVYFIVYIHIFGIMVQYPAWPSAEALHSKAPCAGPCEASPRLSEDGPPGPSAGGSAAPAHVAGHGPGPWHGHRQMRIGIGVCKKGSIAIQPKKGISSKGNMFDTCNTSFKIYEYIQ